MVVERKSNAYNAFDRERFVLETHRSERDDFARDRARVVHSAALRRLAAKTQVLSPASSADFARNRLTHSLEVAQVGRELATQLDLNPDIVDTACLSHDLGHPPFGHNGERALNEWAADIGGFEGNAQSLRILTRLEPKVVARDGSPAGLNLSRASLDAATKYPWTAADPVADVSGGGRLKFGVYAEDEPVFHWLREGAPGRERCIEAEVMDLSDDIGYSVHDFEDAIINGYLSAEHLADLSQRDCLLDGIQAWVGPEFNRDELGEALDRLMSLWTWPISFTGSRGELAQLKNFTSDLIGRFARAATAATRAAYPQTSLVRYGAHVVVPRNIEAEISVLKGIVGASVMALEHRRPLYAEQRRMLARIADALTERGAAALEPAFASDYRSASDDDARMRIIVDQVASLTDQGALALHNRLIGEIDPMDIGMGLTAPEAVNT